MSDERTVTVTLALTKGEAYDLCWPPDLIDGGRDLRNARRKLLAALDAVGCRPKFGEKGNQRPALAASAPKGD